MSELKLWASTNEPSGHCEHSSRGVSPKPFWSYLQLLYVSVDDDTTSLETAEGTMGVGGRGGTRTRRDRPSVCFVSLCAYAYFEPEAGAPPGGAERQLYLVGRQLRTEFDVHFVVGDYGQPETERSEGVTLHRAYTPSADLDAHRRVPQLIELFRAMRRADADVYVFRGDYAKATVTYAFAKLLGKRWVYNLAVDSHAESNRRPLPDPSQAVFSRVVANADHVVTQSTHQQRRLRSSFGVESTVVPNGYPPVESDSTADDREFFLYVGRIDRSQKRTHRFLELAERLPDESFVLVGPENNDAAYFEQVTKKAEALDNVEYLGEVDPDEIHEYFSRAIALVNVSSQEGFPNTFLEAWRTATPVISLEVDTGRFLDGDAVGYADGNFDELVSIAKRYADSTETARSAGERGQRGFEENYHIAETAAKYAAVLRSCTERSDRVGQKRAMPGD